MEQLLIEIAKQSPVALVAVFAIWRMSIVMVSIADGLVKIATSNAESVADMAENGKKTGQ